MAHLPYGFLPFNTFYKAIDRCQSEIQRQRLGFLGHPLKRAQMEAYGFLYDGKKYTFSEEGHW